MTQYVQCTNFQTTNEDGNDNAEVDILDVENPAEQKKSFSYDVEFFGLICAFQTDRFQSVTFWIHWKPCRRKDR